MKYTKSTKNRTTPLPSLGRYLFLSKSHLSKLSLNLKFFKELIKAGHNHKLKYHKHDQKKTAHNNAKDKLFGLTYLITKLILQKLADFS